MTVNRVTHDNKSLIFCAKCYWQSNGIKNNNRKLWQNTWERYPEKDIKYDNGKVAEYAFKCRNCGDITYYFYMPDLGIITPKNNKGVK